MVIKYTLAILLMKLGTCVSPAHVVTTLSLSPYMAFKQSSISPLNIAFKDQETDFSRVNRVAGVNFLDLDSYQVQHLGF